jgi:hypothetical protein
MFWLAAMLGPRRFARLFFVFVAILGFLLFCATR